MLRSNFVKNYNSRRALSYSTDINEKVNRLVCTILFYPSNYTKASPIFREAVHRSFSLETTSNEFGIYRATYMFTRGLLEVISGRLQISTCFADVHKVYRPHRGRWTARYTVEKIVRTLLVKRWTSQQFVENEQLRPSGLAWSVLCHAFTTILKVSDF